MGEGGARFGGPLFVQGPRPAPLSPRIRRPKGAWSR